MSTCIKSRMSLNFGQIGPLTTELAALERLKISHRLIMGKCWLHACSFIFDRIIIKVASSQDRHKSSIVFDFGPNQSTHFGVTCPWVTKITHFWTWISLKPVGQSWSNFICSINGVGKRLHKVSGQIGSKLIDLNWENDVSTFSRLLLIRSFDLGTLDSGERSLPFGLLVNVKRWNWVSQKVVAFPL